MSNPRIDKLHLLGRMLRTEKSRVDKLLRSDRLNISDEAKDFSRAIIDYSRTNNGFINEKDVNDIYINNFSQRGNTEEFKTIANIIRKEFIEDDKN
jgi:hypothetical protein